MVNRLFKKSKIEFKGNNKGFTLIEMITAMAIMALLSGALYTLFFSGGKTYEVVHNSYKAQNEARIAMSYITVKMRQNDSVTSTGGIPEHSVQVMDSKHLRIKKPDDAKYWWIYPDNKRLKEAVSEDSTVEDFKDGLLDGSVTATDIADIEDVTFSATSSTISGVKMIKIVIDYSDGSASRFLKETITLRSDSED